AMAQEMGGSLIREDFSGNPFLADSYGGQQELNLPSQLYFLLSRVGQLSRPNLPEQGLAVSDYGFCQDRIYARHRLTEDEFRVYERLAGRVAKLVQPPDVLILLDAPVSTLRQRIARRGRRFEEAMSGDFLEQMRRAYQAPELCRSGRSLHVDTARIDLRTLSGRQWVLDQVRRRLDVTARSDQP
ncbi:MAG: deoxynucleoside kinase, partial [Planctomycetota bacterium]